MNPKVDIFLNEAPLWQNEMMRLRSIILDCGLTEEIKWGKPCYAYRGGNVVIIQPFKEYCALLFFKGVLLSNSQGVLIKTGENTQIGRQIRFTSMLQILDLESVIKATIYEAIEVEKAGLKVPSQEAEELQIPVEFQQRLNEIPALNDAFRNLTPGRQRAYLFHFSQPKQSKTREARIEKCIPTILGGKGLND